ncbi:MAG: polyribonucleotide nucleotidyltransferase [Bacteroidota bacterium]
MSNIGIKQAFKLPDERIIELETGKLAKQADGSVVVKMGETMLLATVVSRKEANSDVDFLPLTVDYRENYAAAGRFPGGFFKREARPSEHEILISRLIDRALRPLFPDDYHAETQVLVTLISLGKNDSPDALAALAASSALTVSDIPFHGPISEVRVALIDGEFVINPGLEETETADLDLIVAGDKDNIMMVEGELQEQSEETMLEAISVAHEAIKTQCKAQTDLAQQVEKAANKREYSHEENDEELREAVHVFAYDRCYAVAKQQIADKHKRSDAFSEVFDAFVEAHFSDEEEAEEKSGLAKKYFHEVEKKAIRRMILDERIRLDGRKLDEIRPIWTEVDYLPSAHGSAIFTRGETQSLTTLTLGSKLDEQTVDGAVIEGTSNFLLHYNFPPFTTGEAKMMRGTSRREVGHGNLALRALTPVIPDKEDNPYTLRIVSDILESNGSSSMATVCAGTMALMDAGVKIKKPVSGIAMGLISDDQSDKYAVLSDILGDEDHLGDMDFKVTGTRDGITACQMDIKVEGLSFAVMKEALEQAKAGRLHILDKMEETISEPRKDFKPHVPRIEKLYIDKEFIGAIIGPGGKIIQDIQKTTNTTVVIEEVGEQGQIEIVSPDKESIEAAKDRIRSIIAMPEQGETYMGKVTNITNFGAFVEIMPGKEGLLHISEIDWKHIKDVNSVLKLGDQVKVKLIAIDDKTGKLKLSRKVLIPKPENHNDQSRNQRRNRN